MMNLEASRFALLVDTLTVTTEFYRPERNQRLSLREIRYFDSAMAIAARAFRNGSRNSIIRILRKTDGTRTSEALS